MIASLDLDAVVTPFAFWSRRTSSAAGVGRPDPVAVPIACRLRRLRADQREARAAPPDSPESAGRWSSAFRPSETGARRERSSPAASLVGDGACRGRARLPPSRLHLRRNSKPVGYAATRDETASSRRSSDDERHRHAERRCAPTHPAARGAGLGGGGGARRRTRPGDDPRFDTGGASPWPSPRSPSNSSAPPGARRGRPRDRRAARAGARAPARPDRADRLRELHLAVGARGGRLVADEQVRGGLSRASATTAAARSSTRSSSSRSTARRRSSAPSTRTCSRTRARRRTWPSTGRARAGRHDARPAARPRRPPDARPQGQLLGQALRRSCTTASRARR